jgi:hypothetical protein
MHDPAAYYTTCRHLKLGPVRCYKLPSLRAPNFLIGNILGGNVTHSLAIEPQEKFLGAPILTINCPNSSFGSGGS